MATCCWHYVFQVHLVDQLYINEFKPFLGLDYSLVSISGDCDQKDFFGCNVKNSDLVICTAQILENALTNQEEGKHVELSREWLLCCFPHIESWYCCEVCSTHYLLLII